MDGYVNELLPLLQREVTAVIEPRRTNPTDDLISTLVPAEIDGQRLSEEEIMFGVPLLIGAGNDSTMATHYSVWHINTSEIRLGTRPARSNGCRHRLRPAAARDRLPGAAPVPGEGADMAQPLTADQLVAALKAEGVRGIERHGWRTHNRNAHGAWGPVNGSVVHHTGLYTSEAQILGYVWSGSADLPGPLATGLIGKKGDVYLVGNGRANHAGGGDPHVLAAVVSETYGEYPPATHEHTKSPGAVDGNSHFYGWECVNQGDGIETWPAAQYVAMVKVQAAIVRAHRAKGDGWGTECKSIIGHKEWSDWKSDPSGIDMAKMRKDVAACLALPAGKWGGPVTRIRLTLGQLIAELERRVRGLSRRRPARVHPGPAGSGPGGQCEDRGKGRRAAP